jgi:hypothetical protein
MFNPGTTAFILGAGASWHYGYPTGEGLVKRIIEKARFTSKHIVSVLENASATTKLPKYMTRNAATPHSGGLRGMKDDWGRTREECEDLIQRLTTVDPLVIDYFLGQNPHLSDIGKLMIAWVLLECEAIYRQYQINNNRREWLINSFSKDADNIEFIKATYADSWYRFLIHKLVTGCSDGRDLLRNNVSFITFNYDVSLEYELYRSLKAISQFSKGDVIETFFEGDRFIHVYGKIRQDFTKEIPYNTLELLARQTMASVTHPDKRSFIGKDTEYINLYEHDDFTTLLDIAHEASKTIRTIAPYEKTTSGELTKAQKAIKDANCIYILGYGFDENNSKLLNLYDSLHLGRNTNKTVLFTNLNDHNLVNKKASRVITGSPRMMLAGASIFQRSELGSFCEKSNRTVYDALAFDFDSPEEE